MPSVPAIEITTKNDPLSYHCSFKKVIGKKVLEIFWTSHIDIQIKYFQKTFVGKFLDNNGHNICIKRVICSIGFPEDFTTQFSIKLVRVKYIYFFGTFWWSQYSPFSTVTYLNPFKIWFEMLSNKALFFHRYWHMKHINMDTVLDEVNKPVYIKWPK